MARQYLRQALEHGLDAETLKSDPVLAGLLAPDQLPDIETGSLEDFPAPRLLDPLGRGDEFLGIIFRDDDEGELSYSFSMAILDVDL